MVSRTLQLTAGVLILLLIAVRASPNPHYPCGGREGFPARLNGVVGQAGNPHSLSGNGFQERRWA